MTRLQLLTLRAALTAILSPFKVRIHSRIATQSGWGRLWYLCRTIDIAGRGSLTISGVLDLCQLLDIKKPTLYEWLREGRQAGAFRSYRFRKDTLRVYLGSLHKVSATLGISDWGATATVQMTELLTLVNLRSHAAAAATQRLQQQSRTAAWRSLKPKERKFYKIPTPDQILAEGKKSSRKPEKGQVPSLYWVGRKRAFVGKTFIPFGTNQETVAGEVGRSSRSVRRYLSHLRVERRQLCQSKEDYRKIMCAIRHGAGQVSPTQDMQFIRDIGREDVGTLYEPNGITKSRRREGFRVGEGRFFTYRGQVWIYRCNLYQLSYKLCTMAASRKQFRASQDGQETPSDGEKFLKEAGGGVSSIKRGVQQPPGKEGQKA